VRGFSVRYTLLSSGLEQIWFPATLWAFFAILGVVLREPARLLTLGCAYLGFVVPLTTGVLSAYAVLDDPALELRFTTPVRAGRMLSERLGPTLAAAALCAGAFQAAFGTGALGGWGAAQLAWFVPCTALMAVGCAGALAGRKPGAGAIVVAVIWLLELIARASFAASGWAQYLLIFMGALAPNHPALRANQCVLLALSAAVFCAAAALLRRQERYL